MTGTTRATQWQLSLMLLALLDSACTGLQTDDAKSVEDIRKGSCKEVSWAALGESEQMCYSQTLDDYTFMLQKSMTVDRAVDRERWFYETEETKCDKDYKEWAAELEKKKEECDARAAEEQKKEDAKKTTSPAPAEEGASLYNSTVGVVSDAGVSVVNGPSTLVYLGEELYGVLEKYSGLLPDGMSMSELMQTAAGGVDGIVTSQITPRLVFIKQAMKDLSDHNILDLPLPQATCKPASGSNADDDWVASTLDKLQTTLITLLDRPGMNLLKGAMEMVLNKAIKVLKTVLVPLIKDMLELVRSKVESVLNTVLSGIIGSAPDIAELEKQVKAFEAAGNDSVPPSIWVWLKVQASKEANTALKGTLDSAMKSQFDDLASLTSCKGGKDKPASLLNPSKLEEKAAEVMSNTMDSIGEAIDNEVAVKIQPQVLQFLSGVQSTTNAMIDASSASVGEVPVAGPLVGFVFNFLVQSINGVLWVQYFPQLVTCKVKTLLGLISSQVLAKVKAQTGKLSPTLDLAKTADADSPIATLLLWAYGQVSRIITKEIQVADSRRQVVAAAAKGFQCE
jgi:hypothetical protein